MSETLLADAYVGYPEELAIFEKPILPIFEKRPILGSKTRYEFDTVHAGKVETAECQTAILTNMLTVHLHFIPQVPDERHIERL